LALAFRAVGLPLSKTPGLAGQINGPPAYNVVAIITIFLLWSIYLVNIVKPSAGGGLSVEADTGQRVSFDSLAAKQKGDGQ
jgi:hypothetical protein